MTGNDEAIEMISQDKMSGRSMGMSRKVLMGKRLQPRDIETLSRYRFGAFVEDDVRDSEYYTSSLGNEVGDLVLVVSTISAYYDDIVDTLTSYLRLRNYSKDLEEIFVSVAQELITNAVLHGNLKLDLNLDVINEDCVGDVEKVFATIDQALHHSEKGSIPIVIRLTCHDETVLLDIQDQGDGFDFESFATKYDGVDLRKGMDLVSLMARDIEYDPETKTMSVVLEDPEHFKTTEKSISSSNLEIGIVTRDALSFRKIKSLLCEEGFTKLKLLSFNEIDSLSLEIGADLIIFLSDCDREKSRQIIERLREKYSPFDLPILYQKPKCADAAFVKSLSGHVNDFISTQTQGGELVARIKAHYSMRILQQDYSYFCAFYESEIKQSGKTIQQLEKAEPLIVTQKNLDTRYICAIDGSKTLTRSVRDINARKMLAEMPYGHGFTFTLDNQPYLIFMSMLGGLSSVLVLSFVKGHIEQIKERNIQSDPYTIVEKIGHQVRSIIPSFFDFKMDCFCWRPESGLFEVAKNGQFNMIEYDILNQSISSFSTGRSYTGIPYIQEIEPARGKIFWLFDVSAKLDADNFEKQISDLFDLNNHRGDFTGRHLPQIRNRQGIKIPYCLLAPY